MAERFKPLNFSEIETYPLSDRPSKVSVGALATPTYAGGSAGSFFNSLPDILVGTEFRELVRRLSLAIKNKNTVCFGIGGHVIKCGMSPILNDLMGSGRLSSLAMHGSAAIHDVEMALCGSTSEDVAVGLEDGSFGMARETGEFINSAISEAQDGYGKALGRKIVEENLPYRSLSVLATAFEQELPATVHVAVGTDIVHQHPSACGEAIGRASMDDFKTFCSVVATLKGGAYLNLGSAVILPEVFLKALTVARNLGHDVSDFTTANFDMIQHYRPTVNVVQRPTQTSGRGFSFTGHHEIMIPLLAQSLHNDLGDRASACEGKILSLEDAKSTRERFREIGVNVVFTNGCFDLVHAGHVNYLQKARDLGDVLVLGLNSDDSISRIKGLGRPILPLNDRAVVLSALEAVDYICVFEEDTPKDLIAALLPDILVKGGDYKLKDIVGREEVESSGGKVLTIPLVEGRSTTDIIQSVLKGDRENRP
jgi:rfaE bifunctional protein nucleotidyltransferase chain/domain